jgi:hypothetical protein
VQQEDNHDQEMGSAADCGILGIDGSTPDERDANLAQLLATLLPSKERHGILVVPKTLRMEEWLARHGRVSAAGRVDAQPGKGEG